MITITTPFTAVPGDDDTCAVSGETDTITRAFFDYSDGTNSWQTEIIDSVEVPAEIPLDATSTYHFSWTVTGVQRDAPVNYTGNVHFENDGSYSPLISWTQPASREAAADIIMIPDRDFADIATASNIASMGSTRGWLSFDEWRNLKRIFAGISSDKVIYSDGH